MKNSICAVAAVLLTASTITLADDVIVAGASSDSLGLPSSALLLTEEVSSETRGQRWRSYKRELAAFEAAGCEWNDTLEKLEVDEGTAVTYTACSYAQWDVEADWLKWQTMKAADIKNSTEDSKRRRANSY